MSSQKKLQPIQTPGPKPITLNNSKNIQINMSTLSSAQKQMCLKLLASSNINFEEDRKQNCFQAQLRIDPGRLATEGFNVEKEMEKEMEKEVQEPKVSPIKKRLSERKQQQAKQNIGISGNKKTQYKNKKQQQATKHLQQAKTPLAKAQLVNHAIYTNSRKPLNKTVKINSLSSIQSLHPYIQLYIYPKKMSFKNLIQLIEQIYEMYWMVQVQGKQMVKKESVIGGKSRREQQNNCNSNTQIMRYKDNRTKITKNSHSNTNNNNNNNIPPTNTQPQKHSFPNWMYTNFITTIKQKMKAEQLLVNLIQSLNHFSFKHNGIQMFVNFLSGAYSLDVLNYFLVIRALLEQVTGDKIIQKVSSYGSRAGVVYKMKLNPYTKEVQQQRVYDFLEVCFQGSKQELLIDQIFQQMTQCMFFDQKRRKNFIHYFDMVQILLKQFLKVQQTINNTTTNLQLSLTQTYSRSEDFNQMLLGCEQHMNGEVQEMELTFQVKQPQCLMKQQVFNYGSQEFQLDHYLPNYAQKQLEDYHYLRQSSKQPQKKQDFYDKMVIQIETKYQSLCRSFSSHQSNQRYSKQIINTLIQAVMKHNKQVWIDLLKNKTNIKPQRETQQLHFIEKLQKQYELIKNSNFISNQFIKKLLTASYLREAILIEAGITIKTL